MEFHYRNDISINWSQHSLLDIAAYIVYTHRHRFRNVAADVLSCHHNHYQFLASRPPPSRRNTGLRDVEHGGSDNGQMSWDENVT